MTRQSATCRKLEMGDSNRKQSFVIPVRRQPSPVAFHSQVTERAC